MKYLPLTFLLLAQAALGAPNATGPKSGSGGGGGGGGGGAPTTAEYITSSADAGLSAERVCTDSVSINCDATVPGQMNFHVNANAITDVRLRDSAATSVIGRSAGTGGDPADIASSADNQVLRQAAGVLGFGTLDAASTASGTFGDARVDGSLEADEVNPTLGTQTQGNYVATVATTGPLSGGAAGSEGTAISLTTSMATSRLIGRTTAGTGVMEEITVAAPLTLSALTLDITAIADADLASNYSGVGACGANTFASTLNDNASPTCTQPTFGNLLGTASDGQVTGSNESDEIDDDVMPFDDADNVWTATTIGPALEELNDNINAGVPNSVNAKVNWSQLTNVPAGFADNSDDGAGGSGLSQPQVMSRVSLGF